VAVQGALADIDDINGLLWGGWKWDFTDLTYAFPTSPNDFVDYLAINGFEAFNAAQQTSALRALHMYAAVCGITFTEALPGDVGNIRFVEAESYDSGDGSGLHGPGGGLSAEGTPPDSSLFPDYSHGDTWFTKGNYDTPKIGNYDAVAGIMHEIGHALGLKHGHGINKETGPGANLILLPVEQDSQEFTIMTYRSFVGQVPDETGFFQGPVDYPSTLMQNDIYALQWLYGADYKYNSGNTTYKWNASNGEMTVNDKKSPGVFGGVHVHKKIFMTIWDGNGKDTYDFSNFATNQTIRLDPGGWSTPDVRKLADLGSGHTAQGSIANARVFADDFRGFIENAVGGSGRDDIWGNEVANKLYGNGGKDVIKGWERNDYLSGGSGADKLFGGTGKDTLVGGNGRDSLTGDAGADKFLYTARSHGGDVIKDFGASDFIVVEGSVFKLGNYAGALKPANFVANDDGHAARQGNDYFIFDRSDDTLWFDANGNAAGGDMLIADLNNFGLTAADILVV
jgi:serralysin